MGCIGLSLDEFCKYYYDEFECICKAWREMSEARNRDCWERARILATIIIQPHIKKRITPQQLLPFPWDKKRRHPQNDGPKLTPEEEHERFIAVTHRLGDDINL